jgi:hypothetical protein
MKWTLLLALLGFAATASAQSTPTHMWTRGTTLEAFVGTTTTPSTMSTYGGSIGWELTPRFEIQALGAWFPRRGSDEFAADLKLLMNVTRPSTLVPYVSAGAGLYQGLLERARRETNPTGVMGAGLHLYLSSHFSLRPEASVRFVIDRSEVYRVAAITFAVTYHFEEHIGMQ